MFLRRCAVIALALFAPFAMAQAKPAAPAAAKPAATAKPTGEPLDLNTATVEQLKALPGIGDAYAKRIVDGRPYTMKNQIVQRGIVPQSAYEKIKDGIVAHRVSAATAKVAATGSKK